MSAEYHREQAELLLQEGAPLIEYDTPPDRALVYVAEWGFALLGHAILATLPPVHTDTGERPEARVPDGWTP